jgi:hypothetical protein
MLRLITALLLTVSFLGPSHASERIELAKKVFAEYVSKYHDFDPTVADLYSDRALVQNKRTYPDGTVRELTLPAPQYKQLVRAAMPLAKSRNDRSQYNNPVFSEEPAGVRINITRFSALKNYTSPLSLLVGPDEAGKWLVLEEKSASIP